MKKIILFIIGMLVSGFFLQAQNWDEIIKTAASDRTASDYFGYSVSISGDYAIVGAYLEDHDVSGGNEMSDAGSAYIFKNTGGTWSEVRKITASDRAASDNFGYSVSISGDYAVVGAHYEDHDASGGDEKTNAGSAYIFKKDQGGTDNWGQLQKIIASDRTSYDYFGVSVSISNDYVIVGAHREDHDANGGNEMIDAGSAYIFKKDQGGTDNWGQLKKIAASDRAADDRFGRSVSVSGDYIIVGAFFEDHDASGGNEVTCAGSAYIFKKDQGGTDNWGQLQKITASDRDISDYFGYSVSISGDYAIVGAYSEDHDASGGNEMSNAGSAYIFKKDEGGTDNWGQLQKITASDRAVSDYFGISVSISVDYVIVGAYYEDHDANGENEMDNAGSAYIFKKDQGGTDNWGQLQKITASDRAIEDRFGRSVSISDDYTIVGAYYEDHDASGENPMSYAGSAYIFTTPLPSITTQPTNQTDICPGNNISFSVAGENIDSYQWQLSTDGGSSFNNITNGGVYSNATTATLNITGVTLDMDNYQYQCVAINDNGNVTSDVATLTLDNENPATPTLEDVTGECSATATAPTTTDNCAGTVTGTTSDPLTYETQGTYTITWTFDDGNGNSIDVEQTVIVDDVTNPETPTLSDLTDECSVTATAPTTTDNCAGTVTGTTSDPLTYETQGTYTITWTFNDGNSNSIDVGQTVIVDDITNPETPTLSDLTDECSVTATAPTTTDNCAGTITGTTSDPLTYETQGTYTITWTFDDGNGNSIDVEQTVIVDDVTNPETPTLSDLTDECSVTATAPTTTDNCAGTVTGTTSDPLTYETQGTYTITWTFNDGNSNSIDVGQTVIVDDITNPETPTLSDLTDECSVTATAPTTTDNCAGTITGTTSDPLTYETQGTYTITWTFDDGNGNSIDVGQTVIVDDVTNPTITCVGNQEVDADDTHTYTVAGTEFDPTVTDDNCGVASVINNFNSTATLDGAALPEGRTTITWTVIDIAGNETQCSFVVLVNAYVGINKLAEFGVLIYPNPTNGRINFEFANNNIKQIIISDLSGKVLIEKTEIRQNEIINISSFETGIYIIRIQTDKEIYTTKIVKE
ncbi:MAG: T9SS type A sorting domain-containing protein [Bacteroidales bacterium]|nr:T9SS type A sorting domain-containing protein [Bacteroidales bacterium]